MPRKLKGIRRHGSGWEAYVRIKGVLHRKTFALDTTPERMKAWRVEEQKKHRPIRPPGGSFAEDIQTYLAKPEIAAQSYVKHKTAHLKLWQRALGGDRTRASITRDDIETVLQRWLKEELSEPTVYHRRSTLQSLYVVLDKGTEQPNVVRQTTCPKAWKAKDRSVAYPVLRQIVHAMPEERCVKKGIREPSLARLYAEAILESGMRPCEVVALRPGDLDLDGGRVRMPESKKGAGVESRWRPLSAAAVAVFRKFHAADAYRQASVSAISHSVKRAVRRVLGKKSPVRLYDFRHSLGADSYRQTKDLATVGRILGHAPGSRVTAMYAKGANADVDRAAIDSVSHARAQQLATATPVDDPVAPKLARTKKFGRRRYLRRVS